MDVTNTRNVAVERVLVASMRSLRCPLSYSARVIETVSMPPAAGLMVKVAERDVSLSEAVITALVVACTCVVLILKLLDCEPAGTVTLAGTMAAGLFLVIVTVVAAGAVAVSVTVPVEELPPVTVVGFNVRLATPGDGGGTPPVVLAKTSIAGAPAPPTTSNVRFSITIPIASKDHDAAPTGTRWRDQVTIWCLKSAVAIAFQDLHQAIRAVTHRTSNIEQTIAVVIGHGHV